MSGGNGERIACPRCGANNFLGTPQCWQCKASLPPPDATGVMQAVAPPSYAPRAEARSGFPPSPPAVSYADVPSASSGSLRRIQIVVGALAFAIVLLAGIVVARRGNAPASPTVPGGSAGVSTPSLSAPGGPQLAMPEADGNRNSSVDPATAQAQRQIQRFYQENGDLPPTPAPTSDGRVHLLNGGSVSREEWEAARRRVGQSPIASPFSPAPTRP